MCDVDIAENNIGDAQVDGVDADVHDADVHDADADDVDDTGTGCYPGIRRAHRRPATSQLASFFYDFLFGDFYYQETSLGLIEDYFY